MKVQDEEVNVGEERVRRMVVTAGSSVELSGARSGVNWDRG